jgi:hypothetical protein
VEHHHVNPALHLPLVAHLHSARGEASRQASGATDEKVRRQLDDGLWLERACTRLMHACYAKPLRSGWQQANNGAGPVPTCKGRALSKTPCVRYR